MDKKFYFDTPELGVSKSTCHPNFLKIISQDFYFDIVDDFTPFGNDTGAETLDDLSEWIQENKNDTGILKWMYDYIDDFGFAYTSKSIAQLSNIDEINKVLEEDDIVIDCIDQAIIATGFGQIKITGAIDYELKTITQKAIDRQILINQQMLEEKEVDFSKILKVVEGISTRADETGSTENLTKKYIARMLIMKDDLAKTI